MAVADTSFAAAFQATELGVLSLREHYRRPVYYEHEQRMGFLQSVYSFVFGDGNPNSDYEEDRWQQVASVIRQNGGVVTAEQLAPYLDPPEDWEPTGSRETTVADESFILPALLRFGGEAEVDDKGNLLYRFSELQKTATSISLPADGAVEDAALESKWKFSNAPTVCLFVTITVTAFSCNSFNECTVLNPHVIFRRRTWWVQ